MSEKAPFVLAHQEEPKSAAAFQSCYRAWAAQLKSPQCQVCHSQGMHPRGGAGVTATGPR